jgi:hypothetical protein
VKGDGSHPLFYGLKAAYYSALPGFLRYYAAAEQDVATLVRAWLN